MYIYSRRREVLTHLSLLDKGSGKFAANNVLNSIYVRFKERHVDFNIKYQSVWVYFSVQEIQLKMLQTDSHTNVFLDNNVTIPFYLIT